MWVFLRVSYVWAPSALSISTISNVSNTTKISWTYNATIWVTTWQALVVTPVIVPSADRSTSIVNDVLLSPHKTHVVHTTSSVNHNDSITSIVDNDSDWQHNNLYTYSIVPLKFSDDIALPKRKEVISIINEVVWRYDNILQLNRTLSSQIEYIIINGTDTTVQRCMPKHIRWCSSHSIVELNLWQISNTTEFKEILVHEFAHIIDLGILTGTSFVLSSFTEFGERRFAIDDPSLEFYHLCWDNETIRKSDCWPLSFVGWYAMTNAFEDWAETVNMYVHHNSYMQAMSSIDPILAQKVLIIARILWWQHRSEHPITNWSANERRRDSTQL